VLGGCIEDRVRPLPAEPTQAVRLSVQLLAPRHGLTVPLGRELVISVSARDLNGVALTGIGFVARRFAPGSPTIDSAAVVFPARADSTHEFTLLVPSNLPSNAQIDIFGIAYGPAAQSRLSTPSSVVGVPCTVSC
jgi:hypothetical protein